MKKRLFSLLAVIVSFAAIQAQAWSYKDGDVLLIFREAGFNDVEFDLGNISQFLNHTNGYSTSVTNWDVSLVTNIFGSDLSGVSLVLAATTGWTNTSHIAWLSSSRPNTTAYDVTPSGWQSGLWSTINSLGTRPLTYLVPTAGSSAYSIDPNGSFRLAAYDQVVSGNGVNLTSLPEFGGNAPFVVEQIIPGTFDFWAVQPSTSFPKPPDTLAGTFSIAADGALKFVAGPPPSLIQVLSHTANVTSLTFDTEIGGNYWLAYSNQVTAAEWSLVAGPVPGTGVNQILNHTNSETSGFYRVVRVP